MMLATVSALLIVIEAAALTAAGVRGVIMEPAHRIVWFLYVVIGFQLFALAHYVSEGAQ
jgi:hypothetical protein